MPEILIVNSKLVKKNEKDGDWGEAWLAKNVASSGSYKLKRYDPAIGFVGERFKEHFAGWGPKCVRRDRVPHGARRRTPACWG